MEKVNPNPDFWKNKKVFITGHTGFKGSWLCLLLNHLGAQVYGYALEPSTNPSLYKQCEIDSFVDSTIADIRDEKVLFDTLNRVQPDIVIHMAAQALVRHSYRDAKYTYQANIMGTVNLFETIRNIDSVKAVVNVTTDKCYDNKEKSEAYTETDALGGYDPYSSSKACSEIITASYRNSFFKEKGVGVATARAGNVIGGGDWAEDRLIPDIIRSILDNKEIFIRYPNAIRPWQFVLDPLCGYLLLAEKLFNEREKFAQAWNFGPQAKSEKTVEWIVQKMYESLNLKPNYRVEESPQFHESTLLTLDANKAKNELKWISRWSLTNTLGSISQYIDCYTNNLDIKELVFTQINEYLSNEI